MFGGSGCYAFAVHIRQPAKAVRPVSGRIYYTLRGKRQPLVSMLEIHAQALETGSGPYHEFLLMYQALKPIVYGFVEGKEDPSYYRGFIQNALPERWTVRLVRGGNRKTVLEILASIPWERFERKRVCFFVDRDLSDFLDEPLIEAENLYITDNYSIENDLVNFYVFERVVEEICDINQIEEHEREQIQLLFENNLHQFCEAMTPVMAQIIIWRRAGHRAHLDNIRPQELFLFEDGNLQSAGGYTSARSRVDYAVHCVGLLGAEKEQLDSIETEFRDRQGLTRFVRGKYLIWFLIKSAQELHGSITKYCGRYTKPPRVRVTLGIANAMAIIGPRGRIPNTLKQFLEANYLSYIALVTA